MSPGGCARGHVRFEFEVADSTRSRLGGVSVHGKRLSYTKYVVLFTACFAKNSCLTNHNSRAELSVNDENTGRVQSKATVRWLHLESLFLV